MPSKQQNSEEVAAVWVPIGSLKAWKDNPRDNEGTVEDLVASIKRFGFSAPIIARKADGEVIAGHTRLLAAKQLGLKKVPVRYMELDPAEAHLLAIADNKIPEKSKWRPDLLGGVLKDLQFNKVDLTKGVGLSDADVKRLIEGAHGKGAAADAGEADARPDASPAAPSAETDLLDDDDEPEGKKRGLGNAVVRYDIVFDDEEQQQTWFEFLKALKKRYADRETIGARIQAFILENGFEAELPQ